MSKYFLGLKNALIIAAIFSVIWRILESSSQFEQFFLTILNQILILIESAIFNIMGSMENFRWIRGGYSTTLTMCNIFL